MRTLSLLLVLLIITLVAQAKAEETVHLKNGQFQQGQLISQTDEALTFEFKKRGTSQAQQVSISWSLIDRIEFATSVTEIEAMASPANTELRVFAKLWQDHEPWLSRPQSRAAAIGIAYADKLAAMKEDMAPDQAIDLYSEIAEKAWDPNLQAKAMSKKLETLFALGREREALREAEQLAIESENPNHLLEAKYLIASRTFDTLKAIEQEHPRWYLDDEVRPDRNLEYHKAIDNALYPFLFYGTFENQSARGLLLAAEIYQHAKDYTNAQICAEDILRLYPNTERVTAARARIAELKQLKSKP